MDFESLIGSSAYLAKQLQLRWFHHWEAIAATSCDQTDASSSSMPLNLNGRLVRKRHHSMPFLRRNINAHRSLEGSRCRRSNSNVQSSSSSNNTPMDSRSLFAAKAAPPKQAQKRKQAAGGTKDSKDNKRTTRRKKKSSLADNSHSQSDQSRKPFSPPMNAFQSYIQSPVVRQKILERLPVELHHDETFVLERMKKAWLEESIAAKDRRGHGNGESAVSDNKNLPAKPSADTASHMKGKKGQLDNEDNLLGGSDSRSFFGAFADINSSAMLATNDDPANSFMLLPADAVFSSLQEAVHESKPAGYSTKRSQNQLPPAHFHYLYMQPNNVPATFVEEIDGRVCPLCNVDGESNEGLLNHCVRYHGTLLGTNDNNAPTSDVGGRDCAYFEAALGEEGQLHVVVRGVPMCSSHSTSATHIHDKFIFIQPRFYTPSGNAQKSIINHQVSIPFLQRRHHKAASLDAATRSKKLLALQAKDAPASVISAYLPTDRVPLRQYFHARTNLPMSPGEWMVDSDGETDETWLHEMSSELMDEFEDVSGKEKHFMKLWNRFMKSNHIIADRDVSGKCHEFILDHRKQLHDGDLRLNLLLHLFNLWDSGVVSSNRILSCMSMFDSGGNDVGTETMKDN